MIYSMEKTYFEVFFGRCGSARFCELAHGLAAHIHFDSDLCPRFTAFLQAQDFPDESIFVLAGPSGSTRGHETGNVLGRPRLQLAAL